MASYFDEHDCEPLGAGQQPNHMLHLARLLLDSGLAANWDLEYGSIFEGGKPAPPAAKEVVQNLPRIRATEVDEARELNCPICLATYEEGDETVKLPCAHRFHLSCIVPWLQKTNTCPVCRYEFPTDDDDYEEFKKQKARAKQREHDLETLHDSMFG